MSYYDHGFAAVYLSRSGEKQAASEPTLSYGLKGRLYLSKSGWLLLSVPNALVRGAFDALNEPGAELPPSGPDGDRLNAHISVIRPEELEAAGIKPNQVTERGHEFSYTLGPVKTTNPAGWSEMNKVWFIIINSPALKNLRKSYGLSPLPKNGEFEFHITIAVRKTSVLRDNEKAKGDVGRSSEIRKVAAMYHGSPTPDLENIEPRPSHVLGGASAVFGTPDRDTAISFAAPWKDEDLEHGSVNGQMYMREMYPEAFKNIFGGREATLYQLPDEGFAEDPRLTRSERINKMLTPVEKSEAIRDLLAALRTSKFQMLQHGEEAPWEKGAAFDADAAKELLVNPLINSFLAQHGFVPGVMGGQSNPYDQMLEHRRQQESFKAMQIAGRGDKEQTMSLLGGLSNLVRGEQTPQHQAQIAMAADDFASIAPWVAKLFPSVYDSFFPNSPMLLAESMYNNAARSGQPVSAEGMANMSTTMMDHFAQNPEAARGFSARELGQLYDVASQDGLIGLTGNPAKRLGEIAGPMAAVRDMDPTGRATLHELYGNLKQIAPDFGAMPMGQMEEQLRTNRRVQDRGGAFQPDLSTSTFGRGPKADLTGKHQQLLAQAKGSPAAKQIGATLRLVDEMQLGPETDAGRMAAAAKSNQSKWVDSAGVERSMAMRPTDWLQAMGGSGADAGIARDMLMDPSTGEYTQKHRVGGLVRGLQGSVDIQPRLASRIGPRAAQAIMGLTPEQRGSHQARQAALIAAGLTPQEATQSWARAGAAMSPQGGIQNVLALQDRGTLGRSRQIMDTARREGQTASSVTHLGKGGPLRRGAEALRTYTPDQPWQKILGKTLGGVPTEQIPAGMKSAAEGLSLRQLIRREAQKAKPPKSKEQAEAGNYPKGHVTLHGLKVSIENGKGSTRSGTSPNGKKWSITMVSDYGYIGGTEGKDGDHVDVLIGPNPESEIVFVVNQNDPDTGKFDEHKCVFGETNEEAAKETYLANYEKDWKGMGQVTSITIDDFKWWLEHGSQKKPIVDGAFAKRAAARNCPDCGKPFKADEPYPDVKSCEVCERYGPPKKEKKASHAENKGATGLPGLRRVLLESGLRGEEKHAAGPNECLQPALPRNPDEQVEGQAGPGERAELAKRAREEQQLEGRHQRDQVRVEAQADPKIASRLITRKRKKRKQSGSLAGIVRNANRGKAMAGAGMGGGVGGGAGGGGGM